jgi:hypothetical protein
MHVGLTAVHGCFDSGLTTLLDVFRTAEQLRAQVDPSIEPIEVRMVGSAKKVTTAGGLTLAMDHVVGDDEALAELDVLVVPGLGMATPASLSEALASRHVRRLRNWLARADDRPALAAACTARSCSPMPGRSTTARRPPPGGLPASSGGSIRRSSWTCRGW